MFKTTTIQTISLMALALGTLTGCGSDSAKDVVDAGKNLSREPSLQGNWVSTCDSLKPLDVSGKATFKFEPLRYEKSVILYKDDSCNEVYGTAVYTGEFKLGTSTDLKEGVNRIDLTPKKLTITANTEAGVKAMNLINLCGITDWAVGQSRDVSQGAAEGKCLSEKLEQAQYDVYKLEDKKLTFGSMFVLGAPLKTEDRPKDIGTKVFVPAN